MYIADKTAAWGCSGKGGFRLLAVVVVATKKFKPDCPYKNVVL